MNKRSKLENELINQFLKGSIFEYFSIVFTQDKEKTLKYYLSDNNVTLEDMAWHSFLLTRLVKNIRLSAKKEKELLNKQLESFNKFMTGETDEIPQGFENRMYNILARMYLAYFDHRGCNDKNCEVTEKADKMAEDKFKEFMLYLREKVIEYIKNEKSKSEE